MDAEAGSLGFAGFGAFGTASAGVSVYNCLLPSAFWRALKIVNFLSFLSGFFPGSRERGGNCGNMSGVSMAAGAESLGPPRALDEVRTPILSSKVADLGSLFAATRLHINSLRQGSSFSERG